MARTVLIYGGSGGIGSETARLLAAQGYHPHLGGRDEAKLKAAADPIGATYTAGDVLDNAYFARASEEAAKGGELAGLVYAVGTINLKPLTKLDDEDFLSDFRLNALGAAKAIQAALPGLKAAQGTGSIVLFSTVAVSQGFAAHASIAMAKGAVEGLVLTAAAELAPKIRVNAVAPSLTRTHLAAKLTESEPMTAAIAEMHALRRIGEPVDVANLAAFLIGEQSNWISGQIIGVDGGRSSLRTKG